MHRRRRTALLLSAALTAAAPLLTACGGDAHPGAPYEGVKGCCVAIHVATPDEAERVFKALSEGATVQMPLGETFWAARFGMLTDQFGVPWMVNCEKPR